MKKKPSGSNQKIENQQEEILLAEGNQEIPIDKPKIKNCRRYIPYIPRIYWFFYRKPIYFLAFIPSFISGFLSIGNAMSIALIVDSIKKENSLYLVKKYAFYQLMLAFLNGLLSFAQFYSWKMIQDSIEIKLKRVVFKSMMMKDIEFFDNNKYSDLDIKLNQEVETVASMFSMSKAEQISMIGSLVSGFIFCFSLDWRLTLFAILITFADTRVTRLVFELSEKYYDIRMTHESNRKTIMREAIANIRTIFSFNSQKKEIERSKYECDIFCEASSKSKIYVKASFSMSSLNYQGTLCLFLNIGSYLVLKSSLTPGFLFSLSTEAFQLASHIICAIHFVSNEKYFIERGNKLLELIDSEPNVPFTNENRVLKNFTGQIEFKDVWFKYPTRDAWVLKNVSFLVKPGEITAFVGHSGSGKSTILQLILRFYDANAGQILFDGVDIKELDPRWIHRVISVVQQEPCLFTLSIRKNILYGLDDDFYQKKFGLFHPSEEEIEKNPEINEEIDKCIEMAQASKFVNELTHKKDEMIGEKGVKLSGGQKQRIAIARALIRDPTLLITDEATSALDAENENKVQKALDLVMKGRTSIIIAHRLGTIKDANTIYVFDSGEMLEFGGKDELIQKKGAFYKLVENQLI